MRKRVSVDAIVLAVSCALVALANVLLTDTPAEGQSRAETLIIARNIDDVVTNDPSRQYEGTSQILDQAAYDTLVTQETPDLTRIQPKLATKWEVSADGRTYTFTIRPSVKFASGNPLTAHDVRFSLRRLKHLKDNPSFLMDPVTNVEVVNDLTVKITLDAPDASFLAALAAVPGSILDAKTVMAHGGTDAEDAKDKDKASEWLNANSAGSGPYRIASLRKNEEATLERSATYWGPKPYFARVIFRHVKDGTTQREMVERGDADVAHDLGPDIAARLRSGSPIKLVEGLSLSILYMPITTKADVSKELSDVRVRQAVSYAVDYNGIIAGLLRGGADRPPALIPLGMLGADRAMARGQDVAKAKQLLAAAGYPNGVNVRLSYAPRPILGVPGESLAAKLQADLTAAGIKVTLDPKDRSVLLSEYRAGKTQLYLGPWTPDYLDSHAWVDAIYNKTGPVAKRMGYESAKISELIATAKTEQNVAKREQLYREITRIALEDVPVIALAQPREYVGISPTIKGYEIHPIWYVTLARLSR